MNMDIKKLETLGIITINNAIPDSTLSQLNTIFTSAFSTILDNYNSIIWYRREYKANAKKYDNFIGTDLYNNKKIGYFNNTQIIDMQNGRYDFTYGLEKIYDLLPLESLNSVFSIIDSLLGCDYSYYFGGLPIIEKDIEMDKYGYWHRDAYSLFNNETLDLSLPPFYYTILIPLFDSSSNSEYNGTEFITHSHKMNLTEKGIKTNAELLEWINEIKTKEKYNFKSIIPILKKGDICIFNGYTIHRSLPNIQQYRKMLYIVCKKNWYNDEPEDSYNEIHI